MKEKNNYKGITLIALVITIIVLLILAGVSIATLTGDNGILTQASRSNEETRAGEVEEEVNLWKSQKNGSNYIDWETEEEDELLDRLKNTGKIVEDEINRTNKTITIGDRVISYKIPITLANGELGLDYEIVDNSLLLLYPKMGGYMTYEEYARNILSKKTYDEKINMFLQKESENNEEKEFGNLEEWIIYCNNTEGTNFSEENFEKEIVEYLKENGYIAYSNIISNTIDDVIIMMGCVDIEEYKEKYSKYANYYVKIFDEDNESIGEEIRMGNFATTTVKAGTHTYTAIGSDGQEVSITLTFREDELPRYVIELRGNYFFDIYDNKEQKYITFDNAILELKREEQEIFNNDVTKKIETEKKSDNNEENYYDYSYFKLRSDLRDLIFTYEILNAKIIIDGEEIQNKVCMPDWAE